MHSEVDCLVCVMKQALNTVKLATDSEVKRIEVMNRMAQTLPGLDLKKSPAILSQRVYEIVSEVTGTADPFQAVKRKTNQAALAMIPDLNAIMADADDPLLIALHVAAAGNIIDLGIGDQHDLRADIDRILNTPFSIDHTQRFKTELKEGKKLLYLLDNSGEIVFDALLIRHLLEYGLNITAAVKSGPIINDAMMEDAETAGLTDRVEVIETGAADIGLNFEHVSSEFMVKFEGADFILGKGHGHFETCDTVDANMFFLLKAKCLVVARAAGVEEGDLILKARYL